MAKKKNKKRKVVKSKSSRKKKKGFFASITFGKKKNEKKEKKIGFFGKMKNKFEKPVNKIDPKIMQRDVEELNIHVVAKLSPWKFGVAIGIVSLLVVAISTVLGTKGYFIEFNRLLLSCYGFAGYSISDLGVLIGAAYGFIDGFILGIIIGWVYNKLLVRIN